MKKTVSDAVDYFNGVWPQQDHDKETMVFGIYSREFWAQSRDDLDPEDEQLVCTRAEFEAEVERRKAADELTQLGQAMGDYDVEWDGKGLPPVGCKVVSDTSSSGDTEFIVTGYRVMPSLSGGNSLHRVFVDLVYASDQKTTNSRLLKDVFPLKTKEDLEAEEMVELMQDYCNLTVEQAKKAIKDGIVIKRKEKTDV